MERQYKTFEQWSARLPVPYSLKEVEKIDKRYELLLAAQSIEGK